MRLDSKIYRFQFGTSNYTQFGISNYDQFFGEEVEFILTIAGYYVLEPITFFRLLESIDFYNVLETI